ncbi:glycogen debranching N-terminal domain-containing protein [Propionibacteriaceae bacterium Y1700]|uniref:glycogen debranching N-terminal domain-containing protein n=1 Tax=Microlunatus sp. Y1700 TaxID=3418487 RepID=UPI003DA73208
MSPQPLAPFLHDLSVQLAAPTQCLTERDLDLGLRPGESGNAQGVLHGDQRCLAGIALVVAGAKPVLLSHFGEDHADATAVRTVSAARAVGAEVREAPEREVRLARRRLLTSGELTEQLILTSSLTVGVRTLVELRLAPDRTPMARIKTDGTPHPVAPEVEPGGARWKSGEVDVALSAPEAEITAGEDGTVLVRWQVDLVPGEPSVLGWGLIMQAPAAAVRAPLQRSIDVAGTVARLARAGTDPRLAPWLRQSLIDLAGLRMSTAVAPESHFWAAGAPWYLTLFGRDSLWTARMMALVDPATALGTLVTLAALQGRTDDLDAAEAPGKIIHELRDDTFAFGTIWLPARYYGTVDATPLWICLYAELWHASAVGSSARTQLEALLPHLRAALAWLRAQLSQGFVTYHDDSGHGLTNQGWKDSDDALRFADGRLARSPIALCEVQGYAHEALVAGAVVLDEVGEDGSWAIALAKDLAVRFRRAFWTPAGHPALAVDADGRQVDAVTSNIGHLLGTGLLDRGEERRVAERLVSGDLDSGFGLRTLAAGSGGYDPLSYHCGSVWPHDTAIVIAGLARSGHPQQAATLAEGLLAASAAFGQRLPELWSGEGQPVPYPAACRPQAWSCAAAVVVAELLGGELPGRDRGAEDVSGTPSG